MLLKQIFSGFLIKIITGFDDTMVQIPIISAVTKTKKGKIAYSLGILLAISLAVLLASLFAITIKQMPYFRYISASLIFILAITIYFDLLISKPRERAKKKVQKDIKKIKTISLKKFIKLIGIGFIAAFATVIDDIIAYSPLLVKTSYIPYIVLGIFIATFLEIIGIIYFSRVLKKIPYKKEITSVGLVLFGILILLNVI
jgi:hypothetical protein